MATIKLNLLDNALDYIYEAVRPIFVTSTYSQHSWKYSVLHFFSGIELLLKEKLKQEHWSLIFQDVNNANQQKFIDGDFVSVYHDELIKRLNGISKVNVNDQPIKKLRDLRNRFEHFEVNIPIIECEKIVADALYEIIKFWEYNFKDTCTKEQQEKFNMIESIALGFKTFKTQRLKKFEQAIAGIIKNNNGLIVICPYCGTESFALYKDNQKECKCFVCDKKYKKEEYLENQRKYEKKQKEEISFVAPYEPYDTICKSCANETVIRYEISDDLTLYNCVNCLHSEKHSKEEQRKLKFDEWVKNLYQEHTEDEALQILKEELEKLTE